ncbi:hypothetical protein GCM10023220_20830 [Streptomyces ziwulingensis]|uniref:Uncharacterized protein n=1 Tax=Streptomyces ziwulingensis TaxID=1045501 RepID=A0ABP9BHF6_9ACTN
MRPVGPGRRRRTPAASAYVTPPSAPLPHPGAHLTARTNYRQPDPMAPGHLRPAGDAERKDFVHDGHT